MAKLDTEEKRGLFEDRYGREVDIFLDELQSVIMGGIYVLCQDRLEADNDFDLYEKDGFRDGLEAILPLKNIKNKGKIAEVGLNLNHEVFYWYNIGLQVRELFYKHLPEDSYLRKNKHHLSDFIHMILTELSHIDEEN